jgi:hypothetical protein
MLAVDWSLSVRAYDRDQLGLGYASSSGRCMPADP